jgi:hypothetical protein
MVSDHIGRVLFVHGAFECMGTTICASIQPECSYHDLASAVPCFSSGFLLRPTMLPSAFAKMGATTLRSIGHVGRLQRVEDNDAQFVTAMDMLAEPRQDNKHWWRG